MLICIKIVKVYHHNKITQWLFYHHRTQRVQSTRSSGAFDLLSFSGGADGDNVSNQSSTTTEGSDDEFTKLKIEREKQRQEKAKQKIARSISSRNQSYAQLQALDQTDTETLLLTELADASRLSMIRGKDSDQV